MLLPERDDSPAFVIRTDFSNADNWSTLASEIREAMSDVMTPVSFIEDRKYEQASVDDLLPVLAGNAFHTFAFIADRDSVQSSEATILVIDLLDEPGRTFRVIPAAMGSMYANLWLANMDFADYAESTDADGIFRGFSDV